jgi:1-deoxy-D-xylulose-5-phosphate synthase
VEAAAAKFNATVVDMRFIKPLDTACLDQLMTTHSVLVTVEENVIAGGAGGAVSEYVAQHKASPQVLTIGLPDEFIKHGSQGEVRAELGLDAAGIERQVNDFIKKS